MTGGAGFVRSHTVDRLLTNGFEVVVLDNLRGGSLDNIRRHFGRDGFHFVEGDVRDAKLVRSLVGDVDCVVHLAALVSVPESIRNPALTFYRLNFECGLVKFTCGKKVIRVLWCLMEQPTYGLLCGTPLWSCWRN